MELVEDITARRMAPVRVRRQVAEENILQKIEHEVEEDAEIISDKTGMPTWSGGSRVLCTFLLICYIWCSVSVFVMFALILLLVVGVIGWCAWRLLAKKRAKPAKQTDIDEQAILDAMEEDLEPTEEELKVFSYCKSSEFITTFHYLGPCQRVSWQAAVRTQVRFQHPDPLRDRHPGNGAARHGSGWRLRSLCQGKDADY